MSGHTVVESSEWKAREEQHMRDVSLTDLPEWETLRRATDDLYETFSSYPLRARVEIPRCTHCVSDEDDARLRAKPLHELTENELGLVLYNPGTWGEEVDVKHFLPRLFELVSLELAGQPNRLDSGALGSRIQTAGYGVAAWPASERSALTSFCLAWWHATVATWPRSPLILDERAEDVLCAIAQFTDDLTPYLTAWCQAIGTTASLAPVAHLLVFIFQQVTPPSWLTRRGPGAWWGQRFQQWQQVRDWFDDSTTAIVVQRTLRRARMQGATIDAQWFDAENADDLAPALEWIAHQAGDA